MFVIAMTNQFVFNTNFCDHIYNKMKNLELLCQDSFFSINNSKKSKSAVCEKTTNLSCNIEPDKLESSQLCFEIKLSHSGLS